MRGKEKTRRACRRGRVIGCEAGKSIPRGWTRGKCAGIELTALVAMLALVPCVMAAAW